jgi:hypothetical protein
MVINAPIAILPTSFISTYPTRAGKDLSSMACRRGGRRKRLYLVSYNQNKYETPYLIPVLKIGQPVGAVQNGLRELIRKAAARPAA